jgi:hypothetical protein
MKIGKLLVIAAAMTVSSASFAWPDEPPPPPPPPPPELNDCSPGFWKNHQEYWATQFCASQACVDFFMGELTSKGNGSGERRQLAASILNSWADEYYGAQICTD